MKDRGYKPEAGSSYWKHKRPYGKRANAKRSRQAAKRAIRN
jgi:hypothetical protein